ISSLPSSGYAPFLDSVTLQQQTPEKHTPNSSTGGNLHPPPPPPPLLNTSSPRNNVPPTAGSPTMTGKTTVLCAIILSASCHP
ncbi:hypothetical protein GE21DRAFT_1352938, partial [Neurospora crassa]